MDEDKRATALNSITNVGKEYTSLSDGNKIGKKVLKDLKKLMELELREKYKIVKNKWKVVVSETDKNKKVELNNKNYYTKIKDNKLINRITEKHKSNKEKIKKIVEQINNIKEVLTKNNIIDHDDDKLLKELNKKKQELEELVEIDYITKEKISFNSIIKTGETGETGDAYFLPYVVINDDPKDIAVIINDKKELDKIFREKHFKSFDDSVILDFYNEITKKLSDTKDFIRKTDVNIRKDIIEDLYKKLFAVYDIKEHNLKDKERYSQQIKDEYINKKIALNNSLSFGGASAKRKSAKAKALGIINQATKDTIKKATKDTIKSVPVPNLIVEAKKLIDRRKKKGGANFTNADKFVMNLFENLGAPDNLDIEVLQELVTCLDKNSRYKKDIEALIGFNEAILHKNSFIESNDKENEASIKSKAKRETSENFIKEALNKYKRLKKSFMNKVASDKKALVEQLQEGADKDFIKEIKFNEIVEAEGNYIENVKDLYSYLHHIDVRKTGGAPLYDIKKTEKTENTEDKEVGATPYDFYKILKENYIEIVTLYYKLIDNGGEEEKHYNFIYKYDGINDEKTSNTVVSDLKQNTGFNNPKAALEYIKKNLEKYLPVEVNVHEIIDFLKAECKKYDKANFNKDTFNEMTSLRDIFLHILEYDIKNEHYKFENSLLEKINTTLSKNNGEGWKKISEENEKLKDAIELIATGKLLRGEELVEKLKVKSTPGSKDEIDKENKESNDTIRLINKLKEKIRLLESRIEVLSKVESKLPGEFKKLYKTISKMKTIPQSTEYEDYIINILRQYKINFFEKDKDIDKHPIIKEIKSEKAQVEYTLKKMKSELIEQEKERKAKVDIMKAQGRGFEQRYGLGLTPGGGTTINSDTENLKEELKLDKVSLKERHKDYSDFVSKSDNHTNLHNFMYELKDNIEHLENNDGLDNSAGNNKIDSDHEKGIYEDIWYDYRDAVNKPTNKSNKKYINDILFLTEGEKLHERVIQNDLDPKIILKINFRDKAIYIFLIFLIRTINVITLEFLIEYNLIQRIQYAIVFYGFMYLVIIIFLIAIVNYDSYKLRIIFNYLNIHINAPNLLVQNVLFIIFIILVYILIKSDDFLKYFGDLLDYTNIYNNIYNYANSLDDEYYTNLTQNEKLKLLYRIDIISMIIFIFSAFLVLIL